MYCTSHTGGGLLSCRRAHGRCRSASCTCTVGSASPCATVLRAALPYEVQYTDSVRRKKACARSKPRRGPLSPRPPLSARPEVNSAARSRTTGIFQPALAAHNPCGCGPDQPSLGVAALVAFRRAWQGRESGGAWESWPGGVHPWRGYLPGSALARGSEIRRRRMRW